MSKRALVVGINDYDNAPQLNCCVADAMAMAEVLERHSDNSPNFDCRLLINTASERVTRATLRKHWRNLFNGFTGDVLFYFSGHGSPSEIGGYLVTQDGQNDDLGLPMQELVDIANGSSARSVLIILDCCFSGSVGNPASIQKGGSEGSVLLREGITILAASRPNEPSYEVGGHGIFTNLVLGALRGGAANVRGHVSAASIYAYAEAALGAWDQRPMYKTHATHLEPVRLCSPLVPDTLLRDLPGFFPNADDEFQLDPTFEETNQGCATPENVAVFKKFKKLQIGGLLRPKVGDDLYWTAERSYHVMLTDLGKFYRELVVDKRI